MEVQYKSSQPSYRVIDKIDLKLFMQCSAEYPFNEYVTSINNFGLSIEVNQQLQGLRSHPSARPI